MELILLLKQLFELVVRILDFSCFLIRFSMNMMLSSILKYDYLVLNLPLEKHFSGR